MQRRGSSARNRAVTDSQKGAPLSTARGARETKPSSSSVAAQPGSGEVTLGGLADGGLALSALYDTGVLERLRLDVRVRLMADLTQSLAWLHANPRLMAAHRHLLIAPSTVVIGLDGVARVDVRAAKKRAADQSEMEQSYGAPEVVAGSAEADHRADIYSLGILTWEALAGHRLSEVSVEASTRGERSRRGAGGEGAEGLDVVPAALAPPGSGSAQRSATHTRKATAPAARKQSHSRLKTPPPLTLPPGGEWALPLAEIAISAVNQDVTQRPQDCRVWLGLYDGLDASLLASHQEIAEVVQGISAVSTLCTPEPELPTPDASCQEPDGISQAARSCMEPCSDATLDCAPGRVPQAKRVTVPHASAVVEAPELAPSPAPTARDAKPGAGRAPYSAKAWFFAALLWLAVFGSLAGYVASLLASR